MNVVGSRGDSTLFVEDGFHIGKHLKENRRRVHTNYSGQKHSLFLDLKNNHSDSLLVLIRISFVTVTGLLLNILFSLLDYTYIMFSFKKTSRTNCPKHTHFFNLTKIPKQFNTIKDTLY